MRGRIGILFLFIMMVLRLWGQPGASCCEPIHLTQEELTLKVDSGSVWFYALSSLVNYDVTFRPSTWKTITDSLEVKDRRLLINFLVVCYCDDGPHYDSIYIKYWPEEDKDALMNKDNESIASYNMQIVPIRVTDSVALDSLSKVELSELTAEDVVYQIRNFGLEERRQADLSGMLNEASGFVEMVIPMAGTLTLINRSENITCQQNTIFLTYNDTAKAIEEQLYRMCPVQDITMDGINILYHGSTEAEVYMYRNCKRELFEIEGLKHDISEDGYWMTLQPSSGTETLISLRDFIMVYEQYRQFFFEVISADPDAYFKVVNYKMIPTEDKRTLDIKESTTPYNIIIKEGHVIISAPNGTEYNLLGGRIK